MPARSARSLPLPKEQLVQLYRHALLADVPLETVHQKIHSMMQRVDATNHLEQLQDKQREQQLKRKVPFMTRAVAHGVPLLCIALGLFLVGNAVWPMISFMLFRPADIERISLLAPIPRDQVLDAVPSVVTQVQANTTEVGEVAGAQIQPTVIDTELDYTNLSNWFPTNSVAPPSSAEQEVEYILDIPSINIKNARVRVGGTNLDRSLIQYPGTSLPGDSGAPVIFGHSVLRQFYNPSEDNSRRYLSIFSKIMTLKTGDKIFVTRDGIRYTYLVRTKHVVEPEDTFILEQRYDVKQLKLITCVPEGTYRFRGVLTAELATTE